jgi:hypothetical protein
VAKWVLIGILGGWAVGGILILTGVYRRIYEWLLHRRHSHRS